MTELVYESANSRRPAGTDWSAIWSGLFIFVAIWSVFGLLGAAIFGGVNSTTHVGLGFWSIILAAVSMYIAGHETGRVASADGFLNGARHGMILFGFAVLAAVIVLRLAALALLATRVGPATQTGGLSMLSAFDGSQWLAFFGLFLGWLGAMIGAGYATPAQQPSPRQATATATMRPAA
jgi:hypothetical protein